MSIRIARRLLRGLADPHRLISQCALTGEKVLEALEQAGVEETMLVLELSHREREPADSSVVSDLKASVAYWRQFVAD